MEEKQIKGEISRYVWVFVEAKKLVFTDQAAAAVTAEVGKAMRQAVIVAERQAQRNGAGSSASNGDDEPATERQLAYLRDLRVTIPKGKLTRQEASTLIDEATAPY